MNILYLFLACAMIGGGFAAWYGGDTWICAGLCVAALALITLSAITRKPLPPTPAPAAISRRVAMKARWRMLRKKYLQ